jgi:TPR repeat protein
LRPVVVGAFVAILGGLAIFWLVRSHWNAQERLNEIQSLRVKAEHGDIQAQYQLGRMLYEARGVQRNYAESARWFRMAANQRYAPAESSLAFMYEQGLGVPQDYPEAIQWYLKAAGVGDADAAYNLGTMYRSGMGVAQDFVEAVRWYRLASSQGNANGQYGLGYMYYNGKGVQLDFAMAARLYRQAADQGLPRAQYDLAYMYLEGRGVEQDRSEGDLLLRQAAAKGETRAQRSLRASGHVPLRRRQIISVVIFVGCCLYFISALVPNARQNASIARMRLFAGVVGLLYAVLDLYLSFSFGVIFPQNMATATALAKSVMLAMFSIMLITTLVAQFRARFKSHRN